MQQLIHEPRPAIERRRDNGSPQRAEVSGVIAGVFSLGLGLALLSDMLLKERPARARLLAACAVGAGIAAANALSSSRSRARDSVRVHKGITIKRSPEEVYEFLRNLENAKELMGNAELVLDQAAERMVWRAATGAKQQAGQGEVRFLTAPGQRGTELQVILQLEQRWGLVGALFAKGLRTVAEPRLDRALRHLKQILETGEVLHSDASIHPGRHPARPSKPNSLTAKRAVT